MPIGSHDKVLREMRTEHWPRPELRVWAQQEIREAREALDAECARERDWGSRQVQDSEASESHWQAATPVL